jgi:hypothetical protein
MARTSPDPFTEGRAYQRQLLTLLGEDDPATVQELTETELRSVLEGGVRTCAVGQLPPNGPCSSFSVISPTPRS